MHVTVCIATRDRGDQIAATLRSIIKSQFTDWDAVIVDQSEADDTRDAVMRTVGEDSRFRYLRSRSAGSSVARNAALAEARGPLVACTDDDCEVAPDWLGRLEGYFRADADVGMIYGAVLPGPHDPRCGFISTYPVPRFKRIATPWLRWQERGIGANMAFRLDAVRMVGGFDDVLGAGGPLCAGLDFDLTYRMLKGGFAVLNVPDAVVIHHGFRPWSVGSSLMYGVGIGVGATYMKHLRLGDVAALPTFLIEGLRCISWRRVLLARGRIGLRRFLGYGKGSLLSFRYPIDRKRRAYIPPAPHK